MPISLEFDGDLIAESQQRGSRDLSKDLLAIPRSLLPREHAWGHRTWALFGPLLSTGSMIISDIVQVRFSMLKFSDRWPVMVRCCAAIKVDLSFWAREKLETRRFGRSCAAIKEWVYRREVCDRGWSDSNRETIIKWRRRTVIPDSDKWQSSFLQFSSSSEHCHCTI